MIQDASSDVDTDVDTDIDRDTKTIEMTGEAQVIAYLRAHSDFFLSHPELLAGLSFPVNENGTISLAQRQTSLLRETNTDLRNRLQGLLTNAQSNDLLFEKSRKLSLSLMRVESEIELNQTLAAELKEAFGADHLNCFLAGDFEGNMGMLVWCKQFPLADLFDQSKTRCVALRATELDELFPNRASHNDGSAALIGLPNSKGMLALGSDDTDQFSEEAGNLFIDYIGQLIDATIARVVDANKA